MVILSFIGVSCNHFIDMQGGIDALDIEEVPTYSLNFGFVLGILSFSYSQSAQVPTIIADSHPDSYFKLPVFFGLLAVSNKSIIHYIEVIIQCIF